MNISCNDGNTSLMEVAKSNFFSRITVSKMRETTESRSCCEQGQ